MCFACLVGSGGSGHDGEGLFPERAGAVPWPAGAPAGGTIAWTGVAGFLLEARGVRIAFDPFATRPGLGATLFGTARPDAPLVRRTFGAVDAAFVGHAHFDHAMDLPALEAARIHGGATVVELCRRLGVPEGRLATAVDGARFEVGPFRVEAVASEHGRVPWVGRVDRLRLPEDGVPRTPFRYPRGEVFAWRVEALGRTFHVQTSAGIDDRSLLRQGPVDLLVACVAARRGTPRYLERLGERLRPRVLMPCHHDDFFRPLSEPPRPIAGLRWRAFLEEAAALAAAHGTRLHLPARGEASGW